MSNSPSNDWLSDLAAQMPAEHPLAREAKNAFAIAGEFNAFTQAVMSEREPNAVHALAVGLVHRAIDAAFAIASDGDTPGRDLLRAAGVPDHSAALLEALGAAPIMAKYHGYSGFEVERFIADYEAWLEKRRAAIAAATAAG